MKAIFETCVPRDEVLNGELREQQFAASLTRVLRGTADDVYGDPGVFFANTYPTSGLKSLLREGLGRLSGSSPNSAPVRQHRRRWALRSSRSRTLGTGVHQRRWRS